MNSYSTLVNFHTSHPLPPRSPSLTPPLLMPPGILTVLMNITPPPHPKHTLIATVWWEVHDALALLSLWNTKRSRAQWRTTVPARCLPYICFINCEKLTGLRILNMQYFSAICKTDGVLEWEECIMFSRLKFRLYLDHKKNNHKLFV